MLTREVRALGVTALLLLGAIGAAQQPVVTGDGTISGVVLDAVTGRAVEGARVSIWREPYVPGLPTAITLADGSFALTRLPAGTYRLSITRPGFIPSSYGQERPNADMETVKLTDGGPSPRITIKAWPGATIEGRVFDEVGLPAPGVTVRLLRRMEASGPLAYDTSTGAVSAMTNDLGEYRITPLPPGEYVTVVGCSAQTRTLKPSTVTRGSSAGRLAPRDFGGQLKYLIDRGGRSVFIPTCPLAAPLAFVTTVAGGRTLGDTTPLSLSAGEVRPNVDIHLRALPAYRVSGTISTPNGVQDGVLLKLVPEEWDGPAYLAEQMATATASGEFTFMLVPTGRYKLTANRRLPPLSPVSVTFGGEVTMPMDDVIFGDKENLSLKTSIAVGTADVQNLALTLGSGTSVTGTLRFEGSGPQPVVTGMSPLFEPIGDRLAMVSATVSADARLSATLAPGTYFIDISRGSVPAWTYKGASIRGRDIGGQPVEIGTEPVTDLVLTFTDRVSTLSGAVGGATRAASVVIFPADREDWTVTASTFGRRAPWRSDLQRVKDGKYSFARLLPGDYFVIALEDAAITRWPSTGMFDTWSRRATRITIGESEQRTLDLAVTR